MDIEQAVTAMSDEERKDLLIQLVTTILSGSRPATLGEILKAWGLKE